MDNSANDTFQTTIHQPQFRVLLPQMYKIIGAFQLF